MTPRDIIAAAATKALNHYSVSHAADEWACNDEEPMQVVADAVLAALTDAGIVLCRHDKGWSIYEYVPIEETP